MLLIFAAPSNRAKDLDEGWVKMPTLGVANALLLCTVYMGACVCECETVRVCALSVHRRQPKNVQKMGVARRDISNGIVSVLLPRYHVLLLFNACWQMSK